MCTAYLAKVQRTEGATRQARQCERSELCDVGVENKVKGGGGRRGENRMRGREEGGVGGGLRAACAPLTWQKCSGRRERQGRQARLGKRSEP